MPDRLPAGEPPPGAVVRVIDTSLFIPPSPDPTGIDFLAASGTLLISDSEVDETERFSGVNIWEISLTGNPVRTSSTDAYSGEPTGIAFDGSTSPGRLFISDDNDDVILEVRAGADGELYTSDDSVTSIDARAFGATDPEDVAFDVTNNRLFIVDGADSTIFRLELGENGVLDGVPPAGDDVVTSFETTRLGLTDPEGAALDPETGHLFIVGQPPGVVLEVTTTGSLIRVLDTSMANALKPSSVVVAPGSVTPGSSSLYITDRGIDNADDPDENDGRIHELSLALLPGNHAPRVDVGPDRGLALTDVLALHGTAVDDGVPASQGALATRWSQVSGIGTVTFGDIHAAETTARFSIAGEYVLRLSASDGELTGLDELTVMVTGTRGEQVTRRRIAAGSDDAEERTTGDVTLGSTDLEIVFDRGGHQIVGLRFTGVDVPRFATISNAYIQFHSDDESFLPAELILRGVADDDARPFENEDFDISSRPTTAASVAWSPPPWPREDEAGVDQRTTNLAPVLEEIVSRPGWSAGNALVIVITGSGQRVASSFNDGPDVAPLLHIEHFPPRPDRPVFRRGDANDDGSMDLSDSTHILFFLFRGGALPECLASADVNDDLEIDVSDALYGLIYLFASGSPPPRPFPNCGVDPGSGGALGCASSRCSPTE